MASNPLHVPRRQVARGAIVGAVAWAVGLGVSTLGASALFGSDTLSASAFFFYNAHLVPLSNVGGIPTESGNAVLEMLGTFGYATVVLPALLLSVGGAVLAWRSQTDSVRDAVIAGSTVTPGYFVLSVVGTVAFTGPFFGGLYRPNIVLAAVLAGIVFPVVFGSFGGLLGQAVGHLCSRIRSTLA